MEKNHEVPDQIKQLDLPGMTLMSLLQFGSTTLLKEAIAAEITQYLGRGHYKHGEVFKGYRNGYQKTTLDTPIGQLEYDRPKVAHAPDFKSQFHKAHMRRPDEFAAAITDMYVNGTSTRKIKECLKAVAGEKIRLSRSTVSRVTKRLRAEFGVWRKRDLSGIRVAYLFLDAIRVGMRIGGHNKDAVLIAYGILEDGSVETLSINLGHSESDRSWGEFLSDLKTRGLADPLLACSDGNASVIKAIESYFPTSYRQRCLKHRTENILECVPVEEQAPVIASLNRIFYGATSLEQAKLFLKEFKREFRNKYSTAVARLAEDLDQCLTYYLFPHNHWRSIRTSNKLERLNKELKRRLKVIGRHPDESGCLSLIYAVAKTYSVRKINFRVNDLVTAVWKKLREEKISMITQLELDLFAA
jgi:transposase-like protein